MTEATDITAAIAAAAEALLTACRDRGARLATAESCTGGLVAGALTDIPGSSAAVERGWIAYSNEAKIEELGVPAEMIEAEGAVSANVAEALARGAAERARVELGIGVTGVAGPGASEAKPVGLVYVAAWRDGGGARLEKRFGPLSRAEIRRLSVLAALELGRVRLMEV